MTLSATVAAWPWRAMKAYDMKRVSDLVDFINIKTVDFKGAWDGKIGHGNALKGPPWFCFHVVRTRFLRVTPSSPLTHKLFRTRHQECSVAGWLSKGVSKHKVVIGLQLHSPVFYLSNDPRSPPLTTRWHNDFVEGEELYLTPAEVYRYRMFIL